MSVTKIRLGGQSDLNAAGLPITSVADPSNPQDAATKAYVDAVALGLDVKQSVAVATTAPLTLASDFENGDTVDGIALTTGMRILIKDQATGADNGIYTVNASGAPTRATDFNTSAKASPGSFVFVEKGSTNADSGWILTNDSVSLGVDALVFTQFSGAGAITAGAGLTKTGNQLDVIAGDASILVNPNELHVQLDGTSLATSGSGLKLGATGQLTTGFVDRETPTGLVNGANTTYTLANTPVTGSEHVYLNGILQEPGGGNDYTISSATITYLTAPLTGDKIRVSYRK